MQKGLVVVFDVLARKPIHPPERMATTESSMELLLSRRSVLSNHIRIIPGNVDTVLKVPRMKIIGAPTPCR